MSEDEINEHLKKQAELLIKLEAAKPPQIPSQMAWFEEIVRDVMFKHYFS